MTIVHPEDIRRLSPELLPDFLAFFDGDAFAENPAWSFCFCQFLYVDHAKVDWNNRSAAVNRAAACERIAARRMQGYLAYRDGKPIGWCSAGPRVMFDALADEPDVDAARIGQITCFVVAQPHRRSGVATALLHAACVGLKEQGLTIAAASPLSTASSDAGHHYGPLEMYLAAGFRVHRSEADGRVQVRRDLT